MNPFSDPASFDREGVANLLHSLQQLGDGLMVGNKSRNTMQLSQSLPQQSNSSHNGVASMCNVATNNGISDNDPIANRSIPSKIEDQRHLLTLLQELKHKTDSMSSPVSSNARGNDEDSRALSCSAFQPASSEGNLQTINRIRREAVLPRMQEPSQTYGKQIGFHSASVNDTDFQRVYQLSQIAPTQKPPSTASRQDQVAQLLAILRQQQQGSKPTAQNTTNGQFANTSHEQGFPTLASMLHDTVLKSSPMDRNGGLLSSSRSQQNCAPMGSGAAGNYHSYPHTQSSEQSPLQLLAKSLVENNLHTLFSQRSDANSVLTRSTLAEMTIPPQESKPAARRSSSLLPLDCVHKSKRIKYGPVLLPEFALTRSEQKAGFPGPSSAFESRAVLLKHCFKRPHETWNRLEGLSEDMDDTVEDQKSFVKEWFRRSLDRTRPDPTLNKKCNQSGTGVVHSVTASAITGYPNT